MAGNGLALVLRPSAHRRFVLARRLRPRASLKERGKDMIDRILDWLGDLPAPLGVALLVAPFILLGVVIGAAFF